MSYRQGYNRHHTLWRRNEYRRFDLPNLLREHQAMIVHIPIKDHDQLHLEIPPLPVMTTNLARVAFSHFEETNIGMGRHRGLDMFDSLTDRFAVASRGMGRVAREAGMFAEQFEDQRVHFGRAL